MVGDIVHHRQPDLLKGQAKRLGEAAQVPDVDDIRLESRHRLAQDAAVVKLQLAQLGNAEPGVAEKAVDPQGAGHAIGVRRRRGTLHAMV